MKRRYRKLQDFETWNDALYWYSSLPATKRVMLEIYSYPFYPFLINKTKYIDIGVMKDGS